MDPPNIEAAHTDLPIDVNPPTTEERVVVRQIKNGKAAGPDNIPAEALKSDVEVTTSMLYPLFKKIWEDEQVPMDWKEGYLVKIPKKGDLSKCENYRGITLLSIPGKVFNIVLLNQMKDAVDAQLRDQQAGFRKDQSCTDQIATLRIITSTSEGKHGIQWTAQNQLDDLDFADDLALLSRTHEQMQIKTASVAEEVKAITNLRSIIDERRTPREDVKAQIGKARAASLQSENISNSKHPPQLSEFLPLTLGLFFCMELELSELPQPLPKA
ncbi:unnamed protein product [Schistosoma curassoni]|uniref:Reverse transcriptase domain-containing protein n=1 Tax=Schistosoma curassoni TaxID=6186 RepID=A0A183L566_9TREM|nr:unnamed protein product [Schistosoma curassoni]